MKLPSFRKGWLTFWFRPELPVSLAICRLVLYGFLLFRFGRNDFTVYAGMSQFYWKPFSFFVLLSPHGPPPAECLLVMQWLWKTSLVMAFLGWITRLFTGIACVLGIYLVGLPLNFGFVNHESATTSLALIVMAFARCGDYLAVDYYIARRRVRDLSAAPHPEYCWPIQLLRVVSSFAFFGAGLNKLRVSGLSWIFSQSMQMRLLEHETPIGLWVAQSPLFCHFIAAGTILLELSMPLALFSRRFASVLVPSSVLLLTGILALMNILFLPLLVLQISWIPWNRLLARNASPRDSTRWPLL